MNSFYFYWKIAADVIFALCKFQTGPSYGSRSRVLFFFKVMRLFWCLMKTSLSLSPSSSSAAILVYRVFRNEAKRNVKLLHGIIHLLALIFSIIGEGKRASCRCETNSKWLALDLRHWDVSSTCASGFVLAGFVAVFDFHRAANIPDMYSLHSWCGMATLILFCTQVPCFLHLILYARKWNADWNTRLSLCFFQWVMGLMFFLFPVASAWLRASYLPVHVFCGLVLLVMAIGTCLLGITEKLLFSIMYVGLPLSFDTLIYSLNFNAMRKQCSAGKHLPPT